MREIKFRGRRTDGKGYVYGVSIYQEKDMYYVLYPIEGHVPIVKGSLQQYTGLKDRNGKEIYEGDVIKQKCPIQNRTEIGEVFYLVEDGRYLIKCDKFPSGSLCINSIASVEGATGHHCEIIGNIYENPELLEGA